VRGDVVTDLLVVFAIILFFGVGMAYVSACDRLRGDR
jgi:hypothetical protein